MRKDPPHKKHARNQQIRRWCAEGYTIKDIAKYVTEITGSRISYQRVGAICKGVEKKRLCDRLK